MIRITQVKLHIPHSDEALQKKVCRLLHIHPRDIKSFRVLRKSVDARKKPELFYTYTVEVHTDRDEEILKKAGNNNNISRAEAAVYHFPASGTETLAHPPVIVGSGPAGLFCAWMLAKHGYRPVVLERGEEASRRKLTVQRFWDGEALDPESNVQFGEGGAGTFSDGKLNTGVKDPSGRIRLVLELFHRAGAPEAILSDAKPHLGTDLLVRIVETMRHQIIEMGGTFHFRWKAEDLVIRQNGICAVRSGSGEEIPAEVLVLATGHSARDTYQMLSRKGLHMRMKPAAVGLRAEHPQEWLNLVRYGTGHPGSVGAADYKLTAQLPDGRGIYSFCMCPGGYVVNASSEPGMTAVNGMSYHGRDGKNANSAIVVTVSPDDYIRLKNYYAEEDRRLPEALQGIGFVRELERRAYRAGNGAVPVQRFADFCADRTGGSGRWEPCIKGAWTYGNLCPVLPAELSGDIADGIRMFDRKLKGFADPDLLLSGVESRTSSPVRIDRDDLFQSNIRGIYPCGEGAGYAGGITSAAVDGIKIAEVIAGRYQKFV